MRIGYEQNLEQQQKLLMTPELRQAIMILQMSSLELNEYLQQQLEENPVLEVREEQEEQERLEEYPEEEAAESEWLEYFADRSDLGLCSRQEPLSRKDFTAYSWTAPTLSEHLLFQLHLSLKDEEELRIGEYLIGSIDENGYLNTSVSEAARELQVSEEQVLKVLHVIQGFEPSGVGARDLKECLLIQLRQRGCLNPVVERIVADFLPDLGRGALPRIAAAVGVSVEEVQEIADLIRKLDPKPGRGFASGQEVRYIIPDVIVEKINDEYVVILNDGIAPLLSISSSYRAMLKNRENITREEEKYLEDRINSALWLVKSIEQRRLTLYRVACCIVEMQRGFLDNGIKHLKPLTLRQVADMVGVHESTISRAAANKYMQTPQGIFEMKFFFSSGVDSASSDQRLSSRSIKQTIKEMIAGEDPRNPLSDQHIAETLQRQGIRISRRTVAKYRNELGIPATSTRKRY